MNNMSDFLPSGKANQIFERIYLIIHILYSTMKLNKRSKSLILFLLIFIISVLFTYKYVFTIYEVAVKSKPEIVFAEPNISIRIYLEPLNSLGSRTPLINARGKFKIIGGNQLVTILSIDEERGTLVLQSVGLPVKFGLYIELQYPLFPVYFEVQILNKSA